MNTLLLIDGNAIMHRAFHALPPFKTKSGIPTNVIYGFFSMLHKAIADFRPNYIVVCFDTPKPTFRNKIFKDYQAQRPKIANEFITQIPLVKEALDRAGITHLEKDGYEADDIIGTIVHKFKKNDTRVLIFTGDKDILQLVDEKIFVVAPLIGLSNIKMLDKIEVQKKFDLPPDKIPDLKALMGDPSDNYPGAKGIGPKTAAKLLQRFESVENLFQHLNKLDEKTKKILTEHKDQIFLAKKLATIDCQVSIDIDMKKAHFEKFKDDLKDYFLKYEMKSLASRFFSPQAMKQNSPKIGEKKNESQMGLF